MSVIMKENFAVYPSRLGDIKITYTHDAITGIDFVSAEADRSEAMPSELSERAIEQLNEYFTGKRQVFDLPLAPCPERLSGKRCGLRCRIYRMVRQEAIKKSRRLWEAPGVFGRSAWRTIKTR